MVCCRKRWPAHYERLAPLGFPLMLLLIVVLPWAIPGLDPVGNLIAPPVKWLIGQYIGLAAAIAGG